MVRIIVEKRPSGEHGAPVPSHQNVFLPDAFVPYDTLKTLNDKKDDIALIQLPKKLTIDDSSLFTPICFMASRNFDYTPCKEVVVNIKPEPEIYFKRR